MKNRNEIIAAVDFGTTKISVLVAQIDDTGLTVLGVGTADCEEGLRKGMVIAIGKVVEAIRQARHDAEQMSGCIVSDVLVGVGGTHIVGVNNQAMVSPNAPTGSWISTSLPQRSRSCLKNGSLRSSFR